MSAEGNCEASTAEVASFWSNPVDHFRPNLKAFTLYADRNEVMDKWHHFLERRLGAWYVPWWSPLYQLLLWYPQRNRNLFLIENNLNYRPYRFRRNDEDRNNPY
ncbi:unnamed protein product [Phytomonas sp. EM1]|nr:unnamed protein product [Phytomonas sp. EM1]|eukprot:CCW62006.1 unnamed protein product [Phytomonas sp. isolate EM1]